MKNIVIFGAPGSGKGTQSDLMIKKYGFGHISTGDVLRNEIKNETELGKTAKQYIDKGQLIPDELMVSILASVYDSFGKGHKGVIFDGFPRTIPQAEALKSMLNERGHKIAAMIELDVPEDELMTRLIKRGQGSFLFFSSLIETLPAISVIIASPFGLRASKSSSTLGRPCVISAPATPPVWKVLIVSWVPGSPIA